MPEAEVLAKSIDYTLGGHTITFKKITLGVLAEFESRMKQRRMTAAVAALGSSATSLDKAEVVQAMSYQADPATTSADMGTLEGMLELLAICSGLYAAEIGSCVGLQDMPELEQLINLLSDTAAIAALTDPKKAKTGATAEAGQPSSSD